MKFDIEKLFVDVFAPQDEVVTFMYDFPEGIIRDNSAWQERRRMVNEWHHEVERFSKKYHMTVNPPVSYPATGAHNSDLPEYGTCEGKEINMDDTIRASTIIVSMPEFSASAPLFIYTRQVKGLRVASIPGVSKAMEQTGLSADYRKIAKVCSRLARLFEDAMGIDVLFSTGHHCYFDISDNKKPLEDNGILHKGIGADIMHLKNLPSGEVCVTPNETSASRTEGELPVFLNNEIMVLVVKRNKIVGVEGDSQNVIRQRKAFFNEPAMCNIAEVAIGCNDKAAVTGNILEDEKAGFHWAFGRSDHLGGEIDVDAFSAPDRVIHKDIVYARGNPIVCSKLDFIFSGGKRKTAVQDGNLTL